MKRIILSLCLLFPLLAWADDSGTTGDCTWYFEEATGTLTVSGNGQMGDYASWSKPPYESYKNQIINVILEQGVTNIGNSAFNGCSRLTSITIPEGVTSIGNQAFNECSSLTSIIIPEGVTSIGHYAFYNCLSLASISIPCSINSIGEHSFHLCRKLSSITIPINVIIISDYCFAECSSLSSVTIPEGVTMIGDYVFSGCSSLTSITIPEGVTNIGNGAFSCCSGLTSITIPEGVTNIRNETFHSCSSLTSITIPEGVNSIGNNAFYGCSSLTSITIPEGVTAIGYYAFSDCQKLESINIPESLTTIGSQAFYNCFSIQKIIIPNIETWLNINFEDDYSFPSVRSSGLHIYNNENIEIKEVTFPDGITEIKDHILSKCRYLNSITIPESVTTIGRGAFYGCSGLTSITIPESVTDIGYQAFGNCKYIIQNNSILMPSLDYITSNDVLYVSDEVVDTYREAFPNNSAQIIGKSYFGVTNVNIDAVSESSSALAEQIGEDNLLNITKLKLSGKINSYDMMIIRNKMVNLRELDMENVDIVGNNYEYYSGFHSEDSVFGGYFLYKKTIEKVILPKHIISIGDYALSGSSISDIVFTGHDLRTIGKDAFSHCNNLYNISIPEGVENIGQVAFEGGYGYPGDSRLEVIKLPKSLKQIGNRCFANCIFLTEIEIPENIIIIPSDIFNSCSRLINVKLSPKTTYIGDFAFQGCSSLTEFHLPPYLISVGYRAFSECSNLKTIYAYMPDVPAIETNTFPNYTSSQLYVPEFLYKSYYYDTNWSQFLSVKVCNLQPGDYEAFYANSDIYFEEGVERITEDTPEVELGEQGGIIVEGEEQHFGDVHQNADGDGDSSSLIADGEDDGSDNNMPVNKLFVDMKVKANRWYFFCFPFDVTISECSYPGKYVWRHYDGAIRALQGSGGWQPVEGDKLEARHGYIFQSSEKGTLTIKFDHPTFGGKRPKELVPHASNNAANASWNFVGNPYSSYYDFLEDDFTAPITVWNGTSYEAFRPGDDDCHLQPYEAFFVQKPEAAEKINFEPERRETYWQIEKKKVNSVKSRQAKGINPDRLILNLTIGATEGENTDRMRLVLNEQASRNYELECDAAKFLSNDADAQIYAMEGENALSINERPMDGDIRIGYVAKTAGTLRISSPRMDLPMMLVDNETGTSFDLSLGDYEFQTNAGTNNKRFILKPTGEATGIRTLTKETGVAIGLQDGGLNFGGAEGKAITIHTTSGALAAQHNGNGFVSLPSGLYVVSVDGKSAKVYVK